MSTRPRQSRGEATRARLLDAAGALLAEVGVERISTNLVAARAGVTPPTLYHYFADKYALLTALGERLMAAQNALVALTAESTPDDIAAVLEAHVGLTAGQPGGAWIMRMLRAVPQLAPVRLASHRALTAALVAEALARDPGADPDRLARQARIAIELGYAAIELVFDEPQLDRAAVFAAVGEAIAAVLRAPWPHGLTADLPISRGA